MQKKKIKLDDFCRHMDFDIVAGGKEEITLCSVDVTRPGLHLSGFYEHFMDGRVQVIGKIETAYLMQLESSERMAKCREFFRHTFPCFIVASAKVCDELITCAEEFGRPLLAGKLTPTRTISELSSYLNEVFAPAATVHGALVEIYGVGVLILGDSGVGKSEAALELIQRGHRLIADDAVIFKNIDNRLVGRAPDIVRFLMEIRGIGIVNIWEMYGSGAVKLEQELDLVVQLEEWRDEADYSVVGKAMDSYDVLEELIPMLTLPVKPGRNIASILEVAAKNFRLKFMGFDAFDELNKRLTDKNLGKK